MRNQNSFKIIDPENQILSFYNVKTLTQYLINLYGFGIEIENANNKIESAPPVFYYLPYYIDQLKGWLPEPESFENLTHFNKPKRETSLYFHFGILGKEYIILVNNQESLSNQKKDLTSKLENTHNLLTLIEEEITAFDISLNNADSILLQKRIHLKKYEKYNYDANTIKRKLLEHKELLFQIENTISNIDKSINLENSKKQLVNDIKIKCPKCEFDFNVSHNELFEINYNLEQLNTHRLELYSQKTKLINEISKIEEELYQFTLKLKSIEELQIENDSTLSSIIKFKGLETTKNKLYANLKNHNEELVNIDSQLKVISSEIRKMNKKKSNIDEQYSHLLEKYFKIFNVTEIIITEKNRKKILPKTSFSSDGANLSRFYATIELINYYKQGVIFPIVIDSPKSGEQSFKNNKNILNNLVNGILLENQTIIATIDFSLRSNHRKYRLNKYVTINKYFKNRPLKILRLPDIEAHLLSNEDFKKNESTYNHLIQIFTQNNNN
ncbi:hypothetical protein [Lysinibacillus fusiformis]|uniref:hypothetical protein n=1 Tax=Lysinibacillus fusiformis TaxID=28031 RepID=UPI0021C015C6|nr:hypothetical protein [Lysinibacillus fusiformis]UXJ70796.1 hypothetical protein N5069_09735 [Lysinibacillus fusiformis]